MKTITVELDPWMLAELVMWKGRERLAREACGLVTVKHFCAVYRNDENKLFETQLRLEKRLF